MTGILKGKRVAVLLGGPGSEREVSLRSGAAVARAVRSLGATVEEVDVRDAEIAFPPGIRIGLQHGPWHLR